MLKKTNSKYSSLNIKKSEEEGKNEMNEIIEDLETVEIDDEMDVVEEIDEVENIEDEEYYSDDTKEDISSFSDDEDIEEELEDEELQEDDKEKDLYTVSPKKRKSKIAAGIYSGEVTKIDAKAKPAGVFGIPWIMITLKFRVNDSKTGEDFDVNFIANKSLDPSSRLYPIVKELLGHEPEDDFNLKELVGKQAFVTIEQTVDRNGNVWDNVVSVKKISGRK